MNTKRQIVAFATLLALTGCNPNKPSGGSQPSETPGSTGAVMELPNNTPTVAGDKEAFIALMDQKLKDFDAKIEELAKRSAGYKDEAKAQADQTLAALREQGAKLNTRFDELKKSSGEAWKELKAGFETAMNDLEQAYDKAKAKFS